MTSSNCNQATGKDAEHWNGSAMNFKMLKRESSDTALKSKMDIARDPVIEERLAEMDEKSVPIEDQITWLRAYILETRRKAAKSGTHQL